MSNIGKVDSLWRYPIKSMCGEKLEEVFVGFSGIYGDRIFAFRSSASPKGFPYLTAREQRKLLRYRPRFRYPDKAARPINLAEADSIAPGLNPVSADTPDLMVDVEAPTGETLAIDDPALLRMLGEGVRGAPELTLVRSDRAMTDCRPVSLLSVQSARQLGEELGTSVDPRRFRANIYVDLNAASGFAEDGFVGRSMRIGAKVVIAILERDPRCAMITLDPDTGESKPEFLRQVAQAHNGMAGVYGAVLVEGRLRKGDAVELLD
ncbi:MAG TPA: MOSC domain-containing protein [Verrucomicrobiae bacterium]|nr:MOSC domain-containing protein [Verrucomicrobiae bacterium]